MSADPSSIVPESESAAVELYDKDEDLQSQTPIQNRYTFWYHRRGKNSASTTNYEEGMTQLANFQTVEHFWRIYNHMIRPNDIKTTTDYHLFKHGVSPTWEDPVNKNGGKWMVRLKKGLSSRLWEELVLAIIGEQFDVGHEICGAVISVRHSEDIISVWNKTADNNEATTKIRDQMRRILKIPPFVSIEYKKHQDSLNDKSSFRNPNVVHKFVPNNRGADGTQNNYRSGGPGGQHYGGRGYQQHGGFGSGGRGQFHNNNNNYGDGNPGAERVERESHGPSTAPRVSSGWKSQGGDQSNPRPHSSSAPAPHAFSPQVSTNAWSKKTSDSIAPSATSPTNPAHPAPPPAWGTKRDSGAGEAPSSQSGWWKGSRDTSAGSSSAAPVSGGSTAPAKADWSRRTHATRETSEDHEKTTSDQSALPSSEGANAWSRKKPE